MKEEDKTTGRDLSNTNISNMPDREFNDQKTDTGLEKWVEASMRPLTKLLVLKKEPITDEKYNKWN